MDDNDAGEHRGNNPPLLVFINVRKGTPPLNELLRWRPGQDSCAAVPCVRVVASVEMVAAIPKFSQKGQEVTQLEQLIRPLLQFTDAQHCGKIRLEEVSQRAVLQHRPDTIDVPGHQGVVAKLVGRRCNDTLMGGHHAFILRLLGDLLLHLLTV